MSSGTLDDTLKKTRKAGRRSFSTLIIVAVVVMALTAVAVASYCVYHYVVESQQQSTVEEQSPSNNEGDIPVVGSGQILSGIVRIASWDDYMPYPTSMGEYTYIELDSTTSVDITVDNGGNNVAIQNRDVNSLVLLPTDAFREYESHHVMISAETLYVPNDISAAATDGVAHDVTILRVD